MATPDKKSKKSSKHDKSEHKSKKRHREADGTEGGERKHKKAKSQSALPEVHDEDVAMDMGDGPVPAAQSPAPAESESKKEKKRKRKQQKQAEAANTVAESDAPNGTEVIPEDASRKDKKKKKKSKTEQLEADQDAAAPESLIPNDKTEKKKKKDRKSKHDAEPMDIDTTPASQAAKSTSSDGSQFPFFKQTVSQYLPLFPAGMVEPVEGFADQHLKPLLNLYVPAFKGVLLSYKNPRVGEAPGRGSLTSGNDTDEAYALLETIDEYAVAYGWLTAEAELFCPRRGADMEGIVNLQSEGHVGVICFGMFNASIEASRLPKGWRWVDLIGGGGGAAQRNGKHGKTSAPTSESEQNENDDDAERAGGDEADNEETSAEMQAREAGDDLHSQLHATGYWVDGAGNRVKGPLRFRIKNFEVGAGDTHSYLSIEGTMLDKETERKAVEDEREKERRRQLRQKNQFGGMMRGGGGKTRRLPAFSMTTFEGADAEDEQAMSGIKKSRKGAAHEEAAEGENGKEATGDDAD